MADVANRRTKGEGLPGVRAGVVDGNRLDDEVRSIGRVGEHPVVDDVEGIVDDRDALGEAIVGREFEIPIRIAFAVLPVDVDLVVGEVDDMEPTAGVGDSARRHVVGVEVEVGVGGALASGRVGVDLVGPGVGHEQPAVGVGDADGLRDGVVQLEVGVFEVESDEIVDEHLARRVRQDVEFVDHVEPAVAVGDAGRRVRIGGKIEAQRQVVLARAVVGIDLATCGVDHVESAVGIGNPRAEPVVLEEIEVAKRYRRCLQDPAGPDRAVVDDTAGGVPAGVAVLAELDIAAVRELDAYGIVGDRDLRVPDDVRGPHAGRQGADQGGDFVGNAAVVGSTWQQKPPRRCRGGAAGAYPTG